MSQARPYIDYGRPGELRYRRNTALAVREPLPVPVRRLALEEIRRHNSLEPELQATHRVLLRWSEGEGSGLYNPQAERRETHYDPLAPDIQTKVCAIVDKSPWLTLTKKLYFSVLTGRCLAEELRISRTQLYADRRSALWFYRGRFESERIYG